jgi:hypothetical protein
MPSFSKLLFLLLLIEQDGKKNRCKDLLPGKHSIKERIEDQLVTKFLVDDPPEPPKEPPDPPEDPPEWPPDPPAPPEDPPEPSKKAHSKLAIPLGTVNCVLLAVKS